jgi:hypothetical protein
LFDLVLGQVGLTTWTAIFAGDAEGPHFAAVFGSAGIVFQSPLPHQDQHQDKAEIDFSDFGLLGQAIEKGHQHLVADKQAFLFAAFGNMTLPETKDGRFLRFPKSDRIVPAFKTLFGLDEGRIIFGAGRKGLAGAAALAKRFLDFPIRCQASLLRHCDPVSKSARAEDFGNFGADA